MLRHPLAGEPRVSRGAARAALFLVICILLFAFVFGVLLKPAQGAAVDEAELCKDGCVRVTMSRADFERLRARMQRCDIEGQWL